MYSPRDWSDLIWILQFLVCYTGFQQIFIFSMIKNLYKWVKKSHWAPDTYIQFSTWICHSYLKLIHLSFTFSTNLPSQTRTCISIPFHWHCPLHIHPSSVFCYLWTVTCVISSSWCVHTSSNFIWLIPTYIKWFISNSSLLRSLSWTFCYIILLDTASTYYFIL